MDAESASARSTFKAGLTSFNLSNVVIIEGCSSAEFLERTARTIARSDVDHISLTVRSKGGFSLDVEGRTAEVNTGDMCILDMTRRSKLQASDYRSLTLILPRAMLEPHVVDLDRLHGKILPKGSPSNAMLSAHMRLLHTQAPSFELPDIHAAAKGTVALVAAFAGPSTDGRDFIARTGPAMFLDTCRRLIDANLHDQRLGPGYLCQRLGVSRAKLYRMFEQLGGVTLYIQRRRLLRAFQLIVDPAYAHERVSAIAIRCGFNNVPAFNRAFRQAHGMSPTELRIASVSGRLDQTELLGDRAFRTMERWLHGADATAV